MSTVDLIAPEGVSFTLKNVRYEPSGATVEPVSAQRGEVVLRNDTNTPKKVSSTLTQSITERKCWNTLWPINDGIQVIIQASHPVSAGAGIQISAVETLESIHQGRITERYMVSYIVTSEAQVPAHSEQLAAWQLMLHRIQIPYTATLVINYGSNSIEFTVSGQYEGLGAPELKISYRPPIGLPPHLPFLPKPKNIRIGTLEAKGW